MPQLPFNVSEGWRVNADPLQWMLQKKGGKEWSSVAFCRTRDALLRNIRERVKGYDETAYRAVSEWPEWREDAE